MNEKRNKVILKDVLGPKGYIRGPFGSALKRGELLDKGIPVYEQQHAITESRTFRFFINDEKFESMKRFQVQENDLIISCSGTIGCVSIIGPNDPKGIISQALLILRANTDVVLPQYLKYFFTSKKGYNAIVSRSSGSVQVNIAKREIIEQIELDLPDIPAQKKIVGILEALDKKISNNNMINDNLQQQVNLLITAWLVDYVPFGSTMPSDWRTVSLSEIADFVSGYSYKGNELQPSTTAMATIKNFDRNGGFKLDGFKEIVPSSKIKPCHYAEKFDVVVAHTDLTQKAEVIGNAEPIINTSGYGSIVFSMDLVKVVPKDNHVSKFLLAALLQNPRFKAHCLGYVNGTTVLHLSKKALPDYELDFPADPTVLAPLDAALRVLYMQMANLVDENQKLQEMRDALLPRLMSGEIDVSDIDI